VAGCGSYCLATPKSDPAQSLFCSASCFKLHYWLTREAAIFSLNNQEASSYVAGRSMHVCHHLASRSDNNKQNNGATEQGNHTTTSKISSSQKAHDLFSSWMFDTVSLLLQKDI
jgi:hypothetical protein